jgi:hypothetical protein
MSGYSSTDPTTGILLLGNSILQCKAGVIGSTVGNATDTVLFGVYIQMNATAATCTIGGMLNSSGAAANLLISGSTTADYFWMPPAPVLNRSAPFTFTPSITALIWVFTRAYSGPESLLG